MRQAGAKGAGAPGAVSNLTALLARVFLAAMFLWAGVDKALAPVAAKAALAKSGVAAVHLLYTVGMGVEIGAALMLLLGWKSRFAAALLAGWSVLIGALLYFQPANHAVFARFLAHLAVTGGLLLVCLHGAGRFSLDRR